MDIPLLAPGKAAPGVNRTVFDTPQGQWSFSCAPPPAELEGIVIQFWEAHGFAEYSHEKILPQGTIELMFNLGPPHQTLRVDDLSVIDTFHSAWLYGLHEQAIMTAPTYDVGRIGSLLVSASLTAAGACRLFGIPGQELTNRVVELSSILQPPDIELLREQLYEATDTAERFRLIASMLVQRRSRTGRAPTQNVIWCLDELARTGGRQRIDVLCDAIGVSRKHLAAQFQEEIGLSPKRYSRTLRFVSLMKRLEVCSDPNWAQLAVCCGYYDQAHLVREFRSFSGETPTQFMRTRAPDGRSIMYD